MLAKALKAWITQCAPAGGYTNCNYFHEKSHRIKQNLDALIGEKTASLQHAIEQCRVAVVRIPLIRTECRPDRGKAARAISERARIILGKNRPCCFRIDPAGCNRETCDG